MAGTYFELESNGHINLRGVADAVAYSDALYPKTGTALWSDITHRKDGVGYSPSEDILIPFHSVLSMTRETAAIEIEKRIDTECVAISPSEETVFRGHVARGDEVEPGTYTYPFLPFIQIDALSDTLHVNVDGTDYIFVMDSDDGWILPDAEEGPVAIVPNGDELELVYISSDPPATVDLVITQTSSGGGQPGPK